MSSTLTLQDIAARLSQFPHDRYLYVGGFMRGVALAAGAYVLVEILINLKEYKYRLVPWLAAFAATMVTLTTWGRGVLLTNSRANVLDTLLPTLMGIVEFGLFAVLYPRRGLDGKDIRWANDTEPWHLWPFANALHALLAVFLVLNRIYNTDPIKDFEPRLQPLANQYMDWMRGDWKGALGTAIVITILGYFTLPLARKKSRWYLAFCFLPVIVYSGVVNMAEHQRQLTDDYVFGLAAAPTPSPSPPCQQVLDEIRRAVCR